VSLSSCSNRYLRTTTLSHAVNESTRSACFVNIQSRLVVLPPIMLILESKNLLDLPITQRRLPLTHLPCHRSVRRILLQELLGRHLCRDETVGSIEDLEPKPRLLNSQVTHLAQVPRIDVRPSIALPGHGLVDVRGEVALVLVRLDDIADAQDVNIISEAPREASSGLFAADLAQSVGVHGVDVVVFFQREGVVVGVAFAEADAIGRLAGGCDDFLDAEFGGGFDHVVGGGDVGAEAFVVGD
jgi:hypothetical protein